MSTVWAAIGCEGCSRRFFITRNRVIKKPSGQERTAAEMKDTAKGSPPQAKNPAKQDSYDYTGKD